MLTPGDPASVATTAESKFPLWFDEPCAWSNLEPVRKISGETVVPLGWPGHPRRRRLPVMLREGLIDLLRPDRHRGRDSTDGLHPAQTAP
jgi:hypothetical protein